MSLVRSLTGAIQELHSSSRFSVSEIHFVDNSNESTWNLSSFAESGLALEKLGTRMVLHRGQGNVGYGRAHNIALQSINSAYHLILNPDILVEKDCLVAGLSYLEGHENVVLVSPHAEDDQRRKQYLCKTFPAVFTLLIRGFFPTPLKAVFDKRLARFEMRSLPESKPTGSVPIVSGCFMLVRTNILRSLGGFDSRYFLYFEDFDLSARLRRNGDLVYLPSMRIQHAGGNAARKGLKHILMFMGSAIKFYNSHGWRIFRQE